MRDRNRYVSKALLVVAAVREDGYREILGARVADARHDLSWGGIFSELKDRGLSSMNLIISDGHSRIPAVTETMFPGS